MRKITRGERVLEKLSAKGVLSESGRDFLIAAVDPMHDLQLKDLQGWPDLESSSSVVRCIKQSLPIVKPAAFPVAPWDCYIVQYPTLDDHSHGVATRTAPDGNNILTSISAATLVEMSGLCVYGVTPSGAAFSPLTATFIGKLTQAKEYLDGASRLISTGFEVVNTTSQLNKQGQVTVFRQNQCHQNSDVLQVCAAGTPGTAFSSSLLRRPPSSTAQAMLLPGSRVWAAEEGCYCVTGFLGQDNPPLNPNYTQDVYNIGASVEDETETNNVTQLFIPEWVTTGTRQRFQATKIMPIHMAGAIFSGVSDETTLTLFQNTYIESFPGPAEPSILVLATPSACYDPVALEILSQAMSRLPVGVPSKMNAFGDWFMSAVESVANFVTPVALALGQPGIAAVSGAIGAGAGGLKNYLAAPSPNSRPQLGYVQNSNRPNNKKKKKKKNKNKGNETDIVVRR